MFDNSIKITFLWLDMTGDGLKNYGKTTSNYRAISIISSIWLGMFFSNTF